jgi:hypothetical protein
MKKDLIFVITFRFYMKKQAERKTYLDTQLGDTPSVKQNPRILTGPR